MKFKKGQLKKISIICLLVLVLTIVLVFAIPQITHEDNPVDGFTTSNKSIELNFNITESNLKEVKFFYKNNSYQHLNKKKA